MICLILAILRFALPEIAVEPYRSWSYYHIYVILRIYAFPCGWTISALVVARYSSGSISKSIWLFPLGIAVWFKFFLGWYLYGFRIR